MKKWLSVLTAAAACVLLVSVSGLTVNAASKYDYHGVTEEQAISDSEYRIQELAQAVQSGDSSTFTSDNPEVSYEKSAEQWNEMLTKLGDVTGFATDPSKMSAQIKNDEMTVSVGLTGSTGRTGTVTVIYNTYGPKEIQSSINDTFGEGMAKAGMNTLLGMGMAFFVLILIALVIKFAFPPINRLSQKMEADRNKTDVRKTAAPQVESTVPAAEAPQAAQDDGALVAVIAAAVAAAEGRSNTNGFVVRSIRKSRTR
ncbi:MAG: OadG family protein [Lachnospiraceae bacterium]|jgi:sodium pump decarboxylase gamma subunit|nr:OadG family protein [Lachnospiraceae bacterium]